jgi:hypothetical protein
VLFLPLLLLLLLLLLLRCGWFLIISAPAGTT